LKKKKTTKDQLSLSSCINLTGAKSVARTTHDSMSDKNRDEARDEINKTLKTKINKKGGEKYFAGHLLRQSQ
jgi:hypothetical protein